jgi:hypothetical protein
MARQITTGILHEHYTALADEAGHAASVLSERLSAAHAEADEFGDR